MFKGNQEEEEVEFIIRMYWLYRKLTRGLIACSFIINMVFALFVIREGNNWVALVFGLNVFVATWAYYTLVRQHPKEKKPKEKNPIVG